MTAWVALALLAPHQEEISLVVCTPITSDLSRVGDYVLFATANWTRFRGVEIPAGTPAVGKVARQSKKVAFSPTRVLFKGDSMFASPHAVISITADYIRLPDGRTISVRIRPAPRTDDFNERKRLTAEFWPQSTLEPPRSRPLTEEEAEQWQRLFRVATDRRLNLGRLAGSKDSDDVLHNVLASMRDVLSVRQTVEFADTNGVGRLQEAATALRGHSINSLSRDKATTSAIALTFAATVEVANLYRRSHNGIRAWERRKQIGIMPGVVVQADLLEID